MFLTILFFALAAGTSVGAPKIEALNQSCTGWVASVGSAELLLQLPSGGEPLRFAASKTLASGGYPRDQIAPYRYCLSDLRFGDKVSVEYSRINGVNVCEAVAIRRRPGGRIPKSNGPSDEQIPYHLRMQALQDYEEKGTPLPAYLEPLPWGRETAPPPRLVNR